MTAQDTLFPIPPAKILRAYQPLRIVDDPDVAAIRERPLLTFDEQVGLGRVLWCLLRADSLAEPDLTAWFPMWDAQDRMRSIVTLLIHALDALRAAAAADEVPGMPLPPPATSLTGAFPLDRPDLVEVTFRTETTPWDPNLVELQYHPSWIAEDGVAERAYGVIVAGTETKHGGASFDEAKARRLAAAFAELADRLACSQES